MPFTIGSFNPETKNPGDLARSQEWNEAMDEIVRLGNEVTQLENNKVDRSGAESMTGPLEVTGAVTLGDSLHFNNGTTPLTYIFASGTSNAERPVISHSPPFPTWGLSYRDVGDLMIFQRGGSPVMTVDLSQRQVGIGTDNPNFTLDVRGTIGNNTTQHHSDVRWKKNIFPIADALSKVMKLRGVSFAWRTAEYAEMNFPQGQQVGLIAQEVEEVIPEVVSTAEDGYKSVAYANLVAVLIEAVKELQTEVTQLKAALETAQSTPANGHLVATSAD